MNILQKLTELFGHHAEKLPTEIPSLDSLTSNLPQDLNSLDEVKAKAQELVEQHTDTLQQVTDKIPGEADDKLAETIQNKL